MSRIFFGFVPILLSVVATVTTAAQSSLNASEARRVASVFDTKTSDSLKCSVTKRPPGLDFAFRYDAGYILRCRVGDFEGKKNTLAIFARVTPTGRPPVVLGERIEIPEITPKLIGGRDPAKLKTMFAVSGTFGVGEGDYLVEILAIDALHRTARKKWKLHVAANRSARQVPLALQPFSVEPMVRPASDLVAAPADGKIRLTVLLDAVPIIPYQSYLRAWDRSFLLESLYSLLRETPYKSVRLVAFNIEQQRVIYRQDRFDGAAFIGLARAMSGMETATVSVQSLEKRNSPEFLIDLVKTELTEAEPPDAVVFLGPSARTWTGKVGGDLLPARSANRPPIVYFKYFPWASSPFPDGIEQLTRALDGKTHLIRTPEDLGKSIKELLTQLKQE